LSKFVGVLQKRGEPSIWDKDLLSFTLDMDSGSFKSGLKGLLSGGEGMKLWSKGLGKRTLVLHLAEAEVEDAGEELLIKGVIKEPVWWEYTIRMTEDDVLDFFKVAVNRTAVGYLVSSRKAGRLFVKITLELVKLLFLWISLWLGKPLRKGAREAPTEELEEVEAERL